MIDLSSIDFVELCERLGLRNARMTSGGIEVSYSCHRPEHTNNDESPSAYINSNNGLMMCHGCKFHGSVVVLVADIQQVSRVTAERWLRDTFGIEFNEPIGGSMAAETEARFRLLTPALPIARPPESYLSSVRLDWHVDPLETFQQYMIDRGLSRESLTDWQIGYDYLSDRLTIPVRDLDGELTGVKGRDWCGSHPAKYLVIGDRPGSSRLRYGFGTYEVSEVVFGLDRARETRWAVLVEGELDAIALSQMGIPRPIASNGSNFSSRQARLIVDECDEVVVMYDAGAAGEAGTARVVEALEPFIRVRVAEPLDVDPCDALKLGAQLSVLEVIERAESSLARAILLR